MFRLYGSLVLGKSAAVFWNAFAQRYFVEKVPGYFTSKGFILIKLVLLEMTSDETNSGLARFINDKDKSVAANCRMKKVQDDEGRPHCIFLSTRVILPGQFNFSNCRTIFCNVFQNSQVIETQI